MPDPAGKCTIHRRLRCVMTDKQIIQYAVEEGFAAAVVVDTADIVFDPSFRGYCEENLCGQFDANYSCPPTCGTPEEMKQKVLAHQNALVLQTILEISDYSDAPAIKQAKNSPTPPRSGWQSGSGQRAVTALPLGPAAAPCVLPAPSQRGSHAAFRNISFPVCPPTVFSSKNWRTSAVWSMTAGVVCWRSSGCIFSAEK